MVDKIERDFKGVWIPKQIWIDENLGWSEKLLLVEINSLDNEEGCFASNEYLGNFFGLSKDRISKMVKSLRDKGYLDYTLTYKEGTKQVDKRIIKVDKIKFNGICLNKDTYSLKQLEGIGEKNGRGIGENNEDNNTSINNTININNIPPTKSKDKYDESSPYYQMAQYLYNKILDNNPNAKQPNYQKWSNDFRLIVERDKRDTKQLKEIIDFTQTDSFWKTAVFSPSSIRDKYDRFVVIISEKGKNKYNGNKEYQKQDAMSLMLDKFENGGFGNEKTDERRSDGLLIPQDVGTL